MIRRIISVLTVVLVMVAAMAPVGHAAPKKPAPENFGGSENSTEHRSNESGTGNFGQCHRQGTVDGNESSTYNPSEQNDGEADCREAGDLHVASTAFCPAPAEPAAESQLTFHPTQDEEASARCSV